MNELEEQLGEQFSIEKTHANLVAQLCKPGQVIIESMDGDKMHLLHMASKLCSEAGELMDAVGKLCFYNKELDRENVMEELGDIEFYMQGLRSKLNINKYHTLLHNIGKLNKRYSDGYSDKSAHERADKLAEKDPTGQP